MKPLTDQRIEHYRLHIRRFLSDAIRYFSRADAARASSLDIALQRTLSESFTDASRLDEAAEHQGRERQFLGGYLRSVFESPGAFQAHCAVAEMPLPKEALRAAMLAVSRDESPDGPLIAYRFRNYLRDGYSAGEALSFLSVEISKEFENGNAWLLRTLADATRMKINPSLHGLIIRCWLPLALWNMDDIRSKECRLRAAWEVAQSAGMPVPEWPEPTGSNPYPITKLLARARSAIRTRRR